MTKKAYSSKEMIDILKNAGFALDRVKGSHHIFFNSETKRRAVVPHPQKDLPFGTAMSIFKQAGIE